jgi:hypothetical protein
MQRLTSADIPAADQEAVHGHLAKHYTQFDKQPPSFEDLQRAATRTLPEEAFEDAASLRALLAAAPAADPADPAGTAPSRREAGGGSQPRLVRARTRIRVARYTHNLNP